MLPKQMWAAKRCEDKRKTHKIFPLHRRFIFDILYHFIFEIVASFIASNNWTINRKIIQQPYSKYFSYNGALS